MNANRVHGSFASPPGGAGAGNDPNAFEFESGVGRDGAVPLELGVGISFSGIIVCSPVGRKMPPPARTVGRFVSPFRLVAERVTEGETSLGGGSVEGVEGFGAGDGLVKGRLDTALRRSEDTDVVWVATVGALVDLASAGTDSDADVADATAGSTILIGTRRRFGGAPVGKGGAGTSIGVL